MSLFKSILSHFKNKTHTETQEIEIKEQENVNAQPHVLTEYNGSLVPSVEFEDLLSTLAKRKENE